MRKLRWEVQNFRDSGPCQDGFISFSQRFKTRQDAGDFMDRERDHGRLFLGACLWLILPGGRRVCRRYYDGGEELRRYLTALRAGEVYAWQQHHGNRVCNNSPQSDDWFDHDSQLCSF